MRGERGMSDVVETTSDEDGGSQRGSARWGRKEGAQGLEGWMEGRKGSRGGWKASRGERRKRKEGMRGREGCKGAIILLFHRGRTPRWR